MTIVNQRIRCANCRYPLDKPTVTADGKSYCCDGCVQGGPCVCSYGRHAFADNQEPGGIASEGSAPSPPSLDLPPQGSFTRMAESMLKEVEATRQIVRGQAGPVNDLMALLQRSAQLLQIMAYQLEGRWHSQHIGLIEYGAPELQRDSKGESVQLVVENAAGSGTMFGYTRALERLASVNEYRLLNMEGDRLCYRVWTDSKARFTREVMSMPGYRPLRIQAARGEITAFLESNPEATVETPDETPGSPDVSVATGLIRQEPGNGTMEAGIDAFFNSRHYLTTEGQPGPIEMKSWRVEISLAGGQFDQNGKLGGLDEARTAV
jgi:hypothetical protein